MWAVRSPHFIAAVCFFIRRYCQPKLVRFVHSKRQMHSYCEMHTKSECVPYTRFYDAHSVDRHWTNIQRKTIIRLQIQTKYCITISKSSIHAGQFIDRQKQNARMAKQSNKVELYFRFGLTLIENNFSCFYTFRFQAEVLLCMCNISIQNSTDNVPTIETSRERERISIVLTSWGCLWFPILQFTTLVFGFLD